MSWDVFFFWGGGAGIGTGLINCYLRVAVHDYKKKRAVVMMFTAVDQTGKRLLLEL